VVGVVPLVLAAAAGEEEGFRPGVVAVVQTFGDRANFHPHVHALVTRGGWTGSASGSRSRVWTRGRRRSCSGTRCWGCFGIGVC
jgi:hypothetical protein